MNNEVLELINQLDGPGTAIAIAVIEKHIAEMNEILEDKQTNSLKQCYLLLENLENGERIFHGKFYEYEVALQVANKNLTTYVSFAYPPFLILEVWEVTE